MSSMPAENTTSRCESGPTYSPSTRSRAPFGCAAFMRSGAAALLLLLATAAPAAGQTSNLALYQELAVECLGELPAGVDSLVVTSPDRMPFLRSALVSHWQQDGRAVFLPDSA